MSLTIITPPAGEPVTLAEIKSHLRLETSSEDSTILAMAKAAREQVEQSTHLALMPQTRQWRISAWPQADGAFTLALPIAPVRQVSDIAREDADGNWQTVPADIYDLIESQFPRLRFLERPAAPARKIAGIRITIEAGFADAQSVPAALKEAVLRLTAHFYEQREPYTAQRVREVPLSVAALLSSYRQVKL